MNKNNWKGATTYRILPPAGTQIKEGCVAGDTACGAHQQGYISVGSHPTAPAERANMTVCTKSGSTCPPSYCDYETEIEAIHCGSYFVYNLQNMDGCSDVYCAE